MALIKNTQSTPTTSTPSTEKNRAVAFVNWGIPTADGNLIRSSKGFPIFKNPQYPNKQEDMLVKLAEKHGGRVKIMMEAHIMLNNPNADPDDVDLDSIVLA